jgi:acyltransferase-like protein
MPSDIATLTRLIDNEVILALGVPRDSWLATRLHWLLHHATSRFSELFSEVDRLISEQGLPAGALWLLQRLASGYEARGAENIPLQGPLVIASNHPGAIDSLALAASARRADLKIIASAVPFLESLPHVSEHLIFTPRLNVQSRMLSVRASIRHLRAGGSLLLFAHGTIDPDPAFMPLALEELNGWSRSLEIFLRRVPEVQVVVSIVSRVLDPAYMQHPLTHLRRTRTDRQRLAMMLQIIQQMLGKHLDLTPRISFGKLLNMTSIGGAEQTLHVITSSAQELMQSHLAWQP